MEELRKLRGVITGRHFVYKSEKHGTGYVNFDPAFPHVLLVWDTCNRLVEPFLDEEFDVVVAPAVGGVVLGHFVALAACFRGKNVTAVWADKQDDGSFAFERQGFAEQLKGKRVLVIDDVMTNANELGSVYKLCRLVEAAGGTVVGVSLVCNRCNGTAEQLRVSRLEWLSEVDFDAFSEAVCQATGPCAFSEPIITDIGHGAKYQKDHPDYPGGYVSALE